MEAPAPATDRRAARWDGWVTAGLAAAVAVVAVLALTWWATRIGDRLLPTLVAVVATGVATVTAAVVGRRARLGATRRTALMTTTLVLGLAVAALSWSGALVAAKAQRSMPGWQATADRVLAQGAERGSSATAETGAPCVFYTQIDEVLRELEGFGRVDQICSSPEAPYRFVSFTQTDNIDSTGLVYSPDADDPLVSSMCVAHLDGPWWQTASATPNCPPGFAFIGGG